MTGEYLRQLMTTDHKIEVGGKIIYYLMNNGYPEAYDGYLKKNNIINRILFGQPKYYYVIVGVNNKPILKLELNGNELGTGKSIINWQEYLNYALWDGYRKRDNLHD